jgi:Tol biopolymer transport system component
VGWFLALVVVVAGCDQVLGLDERMPDAFVVPDSPLGPWRPAQPLTALNGPLSSELDPSLTADGLEIFFSSNRPGLGGYDVYHAKRTTTDRAFDAPVLITELSTTDSEFSFITADGLTIYFSRTLAADVHHATRPDRNSPFGAPVVDAALSTPWIDYNPALSGDGLLAVNDRTDPPLARELFLFSREDTSSPWGPETRVDGVSTAELDAGGSLDEHGLALVFHTERGGMLGDLYLTTRQTTSEPFSFSTTSPIAELNTTGNEVDPHISPDQRTIVFSRDGRLFIATR